ncbi:uncharacterized protein LOC108629485 isoform X2 [Ceratina calcarata]|uniref:Uncharacterized protein LOC108629485 isoform X2 n=1 Tax=Ceratina calcarata TaxID=156304 RepID=A0AAJ7WEB5_9HYME|nr:uncharacterized protein LOC108629485 isoform X2 [Ceratina calcarata]
MYILQQMREEFPTVMANVQYRVLKKKWSNLLQQYKELKNPVHGDRNKTDDISWPFYNAIDEVVGFDREKTPINDDFIDPHEFLCVSVTPEEPTSSADALPLRFHPETVSGTCDSLPDYRKIKKARSPLNSKQRGTNSIRRRALPRLPRATELIIEEVTSVADSSEHLRKVCRHGENEIRPRKSQRRTREDRESRTDRCIEQIFEYIKKRDEENRSIIVRLMHAVESIANKL